MRLPSLFIICMHEVMAALRLYRFEPKRAHNPDNSDSDDEEPNDRLGETFWCTCEQCEVMATQKNVFVAEKSESQKPRWKV